MAQKITDIVGHESPDAIIATTIVSYAASSMLTGLVFYLMGRFKFGFMVGFIPRHILIGCIGGVGWFLIATGFEVSARLDGSLQYDLDTLHKLAQAETLPLWIFPLVLAIALFWGQSKVASKYFLPLFILLIPMIFYLFVFAVDVLDADRLRDQGWIFEGPPSGEPWWHFYTLYRKYQSPFLQSLFSHLYGLTERRVPNSSLGCGGRYYTRNVSTHFLRYFTCAD